MDTSNISNITKKPLIDTGILFGEEANLIFWLDSFIYPGAKLANRFCTPFHRESQSVRSITMTAIPSTIAGIRLDEIRESYAALNLAPSHAL